MLKIFNAACRIILISIVLTIPKFAFCATWSDPGNYDVSWYSDLSDEFEISTPKQFAGFVYLSNNNTSFEGKIINICADLDMNEFDWVMCKELKGEINGNGYKCKNIHHTYNPTSYKEGHNGAFETITTSGVIRDLEFTNLSFKYSDPKHNFSSGSFSIGGIAAFNYGLITDCKLEMQLSASIYATSAYGSTVVQIGGISGINHGYIINSTVDGVISNTDAIANSGAIYYGGISGINKGYIINCVNRSNIYPKYHTFLIYAAGICGKSEKTIYNVVNYGNICGTYLFHESKPYGCVDGICAVLNGECKNSYVSSQADIIGTEIPKNGLILTIDQIRNLGYDFTTQLNTNISQYSCNPKTYWANSPDYNNNEPFLLNSLNLNLQCNSISQSSINVDCLPLQLTSSWIVEKGFEYQKSGSTIVNTVVIKDTFSAELRDLDAETLYNIRAYIKGKTGTVYSKYISVQTSPLNIQTLAATDITPISAVLNGKINVGNTPIKSQGFLWKELNGDYHVILTNGSNFSAKIDNLKPSTTYVYQAYAIDENDNSIYGDEVNFKTTPVTISIDDKAVNINDIVIGGHINLELATDISVEYRKIGAGDYLRKNTTSDKQGRFSLAINELEADMEYELRAYFMYDNVTLYSSVEVVHSLPIEVSTLIPFVDRHVEFYGEINGISKNGEFGFEYRETNIPDIIPSKFIIGAINGNKFNAVTSDVVNGINYKVRAYYKSKSGVYCYGQWIEFLPVNVASIGEIITDDEISIKAIYNTNGQKISSFAKGINIVIYSNGTSKKVILK